MQQTAMTPMNPMPLPGLHGGSRLPVPTCTRVQIGGPGLTGDLLLVPGASGMVLIAQAGSGESEQARNRLMHEVLSVYRLSSLRVDLHGGDDPDPGLLHQRLEGVLRWLQDVDRSRRVRLGLLGAGPVAATALRCAALHPAAVSVVVSRGGAPGQASACLPRILAPTLLVVGGDDDAALASHRAALRALTCEARLEVLPRVSRRFDEPGVTETVAHLVGAWAARHLAARAY